MILNNSRFRVVVTLALVVIGSVFFVQNTNVFLKLDISSCQKETANREMCYAKLLDDTLAKQGLAKAFDAMALIYDRDVKFASDCHGYTHPLGKAAYKLFHAGKEVELTPKASYCGFGFYHGFMEELVVEGGTMEEARAFCAYAGKVLSNKSKAEVACYHGIGHGAVDGTDPRVWGNPEAIISSALALCARVGDSDQRKDNCASGVFNSLAIMYKDPKYRLNVNKADPYRICEEQSPDYFKRACYDQMNTLALFLTGFDLEKSLSYILKIKEEIYAETAADSLAAYGASKRQRGGNEAEHQKAITACRVLSGNILLACIRGFGAGLVEFGTPRREYEEALAFCQNEDLSNEEKKSCLHRVLSYLSVIYPTERVATLCQQYVALPNRGLCEPFK